MKVADVIRERVFYSPIDADEAYTMLQQLANQNGKITAEDICDIFDLTVYRRVVDWASCTKETFDKAYVFKNGSYFRIIIPDEDCKCEPETSVPDNSVYITVNAKDLKDLSDVISNNKDREFHITVV